MNHILNRIVRSTSHSVLYLVCSYSRHILYSMYRCVPLPSLPVNKFVWYVKLSQHTCTAICALVTFFVVVSCFKIYFALDVRLLALALSVYIFILAVLNVVHFLLLSSARSCVLCRPLFYVCENSICSSVCWFDWSFFITIPPPSLPLRISISSSPSIYFFTCDFFI